MTAVHGAVVDLPAQALGGVVVVEGGPVRAGFAPGLETVGGCQQPRGAVEGLLVQAESPGQGLAEVQ